MTAHSVAELREAWRAIEAGEFEAFRDEFLGRFYGPPAA